MSVKACWKTRHSSTGGASRWAMMDSTTEDADRLLALAVAPASAPPVLPARSIFRNMGLVADSTLPRFISPSPSTRRPLLPFGSGRFAPSSLMPR
jgi:hypothetical protein